MPAPFRRAERHRPLPVDRHQRRRDAQKSLARSRRERDLDVERFRSYFGVR